MAVLWDVALCSLVGIDEHFVGAYCLCRQGIALMMEVLSCFEMPISIYQTAGCYIRVMTVMMVAVSSSETSVSIYQLSSYLLP
jgi:hypothetical protein